jgi:hypothetical protein
LYPLDGISAEHPVRMFEEILQPCEWSGWGEAEYYGRRGVVVTGWASLG